MRKGQLRRLRSRALGALEEGQLESAAALLEELIALDPRDPASAKQLARLYQDLGRPQDALSALVRASNAYIATGAAIPAIAVCKWILELDPTHTATLERLAALRDSAGAGSEPVARRRRAPGDAGSSRAPLESLLLSQEIQPESAADAEGRREIALDDTAIDSAFDETFDLTDDADDSHAAGESFADDDAEDEPAIDLGVDTDDEILIDDALEPPAAPDDAPLASDPGEGVAARQRAARQLIATPLFGRLGVRTLRRLVDAARLVELDEGEVLFRQGDPADALYVVTEGAVVPIAEGGQRRRLSVLSEGEFFGEIALVADQPRNATVEALVDSQLLAFDRSLIRTLLDEEPEMLAATLRFLRQRLIDRLLCTSPLFESIERKQRNLLAASFRLMEVPEGTLLIEQGRPAEALHLVLAGSLRVLQQGAERGVAAKELAVLGAGDPCGEMSLLDDAPAVASVVATRRSWVLLLPRADFEATLSAHPSVREQLARVAAHRKRSDRSGRGPGDDRSDLEWV